MQAMAVRHSAAYAVYSKEEDVVRAARGLRKGSHEEISDMNSNTRALDIEMYIL